MNPKVVVLPQGVDPADFIRDNGVDAWKDCLKKSKHFIEHHLSLIRKESQSPHLFVKTIKEKLFPFLARVASPMEKNLYITKISEETGMPASIIAEELIKSGSVPSQSKEVLTTTISRGSDSTPYERLTALRKRFPSELIESSAEMLNTLSVGDIIFSAPPLEEERLERALIIVEQEYGALSDEIRMQVCKELVDKITQEFLNTLRMQYSKELKRAEEDANEEEISRLSAILNQITKRRHELP